MHLISAFFMAFACNVDNLAVAIAFGLKRIKISLVSNLLIALVTGVSTYISLSVGQHIRNYLPSNVSNLIGSGMIVAIGIWMIWDTFEMDKIKHKKKLMLAAARQIEVTVGAGAVSTSSRHFHASSHHSLHDLDEVSYESFLEQPEKVDKDRSGSIDAKESIALALGLSINNMGSGVGGGISGFHIATTTILSLLLSVIALTGGYILGKRFNAKISALQTGMISGFLIILLGIYEHFIT